MDAAAGTRIAVAGGTGLIGAMVVDAVRAAGAQPVVLARSRGVDLSTGSGLSGALDGVDAVIDVTNITTMNRDKAVAFFEGVTRRLQQEGHRVGVRHHVLLSIVGVDRVGHGYYQGKEHQEQVALAGPVPTSVLRATQFHEFPVQMLERVSGPVAIAPRMRSQPIAAREVAVALVHLALGAPVGRAPDLAGPEVLEMPDLMRRVVAAQGEEESRERGTGERGLRPIRRRRLVLAVRLPGAVGRAMAGDGQLPTGPGPRGTQTFDEWLVSADGRAVLRPGR
ncbi:SDR family oxidoreductase [Nakamurella leprariae]|uniref:SDR family oxidoreductase n=1 Tax=Nakamurella leprariae TaxID=2803911 RepID=A0A939BYH1_9ACTN|nr:SDR family oxidoreductase [Nakamurella leprariae]MBM9467080.1 SDR family oxidoreductase [Nakamurella leprariae]